LPLASNPNLTVLINSFTAIYQKKYGYARAAQPYRKVLGVYVNTFTEQKPLNQLR